MDAVSVLVLNQNYEPLNVCNVRRALVLVLRGKAEVLETAAAAVFHTARCHVQAPFGHPAGPHDQETAPKSAAHAQGDLCA